MIVRYMPADPAGNLTAIVLSPVAPQARAPRASKWAGRSGWARRGKSNCKGKNRQTENFCEAVYLRQRKIFTGATKRALPIVYTGETRRKQKKPLGGRAG